MQLDNVKFSVNPLQKVVVADMSDNEKPLYWGEARHIPEDLLIRLHSGSVVIPLGEKRAERFEVDTGWLGLYLM